MPRSTKNTTMRPDLPRMATTGALVLALAAGCDAGADPDPRWVAGWATSMMDPGTAIGEIESRSFNDETLRQTVTVTAAGDRIRLRLSNRFASGPLALAEVRVAREQEPLATAPGSDRQVVFGGLPDATIAAGSELVTRSPA